MQRNGEGNGMFGVQRKRVEPEPERDMLALSRERLRHSHFTGMIVFALCGIGTGMEIESVMVRRMTPAHASLATAIILVCVFSAQLAIMIREWIQLQRLKQEIVEQWQVQRASIREELKIVYPDNPIMQARILQQFEESFKL